MKSKQSKQKETNDLRKMSDGELSKELGVCQEALFRLRFQKVVEEVADTTVIRKTRRKIARIRTILHLRKLGVEK